MWPTIKSLYAHTFLPSIVLTARTWFSEHKNPHIIQLTRAGARIGHHVFIGENVYVEKENAALLTVEDEVVISAFTKIILHDSSLNNITGAPLKFGKVILRRNCYIGADCLILPGTEVGENTIIGAGSLVKGKIKANAVYIGRPAKFYCTTQQLQKKWLRKKKTKKGVEFLINVPKWHKRTREQIEHLDIKRVL